MKIQLLLVLLLGLPITLCAQQKEITGTVTDSTTRLPVAGASIIATGTTAGTTTDPNGHFTLLIPDDAVKLTVSQVNLKNLKLP